jgi:N-acetylglucosamine-6-phosphate deacetylase
MDLSGMFVMPGFIDPHIHGCGGIDVMEGTFESLNGISRTLVRYGTTSFLPTTVSSPPDVLTAAIEQLRAALSKPFDGALPLGIHLEGPFINSARRGTHQAANILAPDLALFEKWVNSPQGRVRLLTIAPELNGIEPLLRLAKDFNVTLAMGHSDATFAQARTAADQGVCYAVHTFNAMRAFAHRDPGIVGEVLDDSRIFAEIIADGIHVAETVVRIFARAKGKSGILLATDGISATGMPDGRYSLGKDLVDVRDGVCRNAEGRLAGSTLTQDAALRNFIQWTGWPLEEAVMGLTINPARALGLDNKGVLEPGADADVAILDQRLRVIATLVAGRVVFRSSDG